jgi:hypothetical protein
MSEERKTAGLLPCPIWLLVRQFHGPKLHALGPARTLDGLLGMIAGVRWISPGAMIAGYGSQIPPDCQEVRSSRWVFPELERLTFERRLVDVLWYDADQGGYDPNKEWNSDRWQEVHDLLEEFGITCPVEGRVPEPS